MQAAFENTDHWARRNIDVVFLPAFPNSPNRRPEAATVSNSKANHKFTLSISHFDKLSGRATKAIHSFWRFARRGGIKRLVAVG